MYLVLWIARGGLGVRPRSGSSLSLLVYSDSIIYYDILLLYHVVRHISIGQCSSSLNSSNNDIAYHIIYHI